MKKNKKSKKSNKVKALLAAAIGWLKKAVNKCKKACKRRK